MNSAKAALNLVLERIRLGAPIPFSAAPENPFAGEFLGSQVIFEGEDDLLHILVSRTPPLLPEEAQSILEKLLIGIPPGLLWIKPGKEGVHFFVGHDDLLKFVKPVQE